MWKYSIGVVFLITSVTPLRADSIPQFKWRAVEIDKIDIGYGLQMADVNGDGKTDIVLADKSTIQWYQNPKWTKHVIARDLTQTRQCLHHGTRHRRGRQV